MVRVDVWTVVGGVVATFIVSWILKVETLFFLAMLVVAAMALVFGTIIGCMMLAERLFTAAEKPGWREVRATNPRQTIAG